MCCCNGCCLSNHCWLMACQSIERHNNRGYFATSRRTGLDIRGHSDTNQMFNQDGIFHAAKWSLYVYNQTGWSQRKHIETYTYSAARWTPFAIRNNNSIPSIFWSLEVKKAVVVMLIYNEESYCDCSTASQRNCISRSDIMHFLGWSRTLFGMARGTRHASEISGNVYNLYILLCFGLVSTYVVIHTGMFCIFWSNEKGFVSVDIIGFVYNMHDGGRELVT